MQSVDLTIQLMLDGQAGWWWLEVGRVNLRMSYEILPGLMEKLPWISWRLEVNAAPDWIKEKGMSTSESWKDTNVCRANWYLNGWWCAKRCILGVLFFSPRNLIIRCILVMIIGNMLNIRINAVVKGFRKLPSEGEEGRPVRTSVCNADAAIGGWLEEFFFLRVGVLVLVSLHFLPVARSVRDGAP